MFHNIRTRCLPKAVYGAEAAKPGEKQQRRLTTAIKQTISKKCVHRDRNLTFVTASQGDDLDPETVILVNRTFTLRRALAKKPKLKVLANKVLDLYAAHDYIGTQVDVAREGTSMRHRCQGKTVVNLGSRCLGRLVR